MKILHKSILPVIVLLLLTLASCSPFLKHGDALYDTTENLVMGQREADARIEKELKDTSHTLEDPLVLENPYMTAPQTAIAIFNTKEETPIEMVINGGAPVKFESSKEHAIPIYGLFDNYKNEVVISDADGNSKTITIDLPEFKDDVLSVEKNKIEPSEEFYMVSPDYARTSAYTPDGKILWYLDTPDNEGAIVFLGGGRFLISDPYQGIGGIRINYPSFWEMDYLGRIHKIYVGEYGYHHEIGRIKDNTEFLIPGQNEDSPYMQDIVYSVDANTMEVTGAVSFYDLFHDLAPEWTDSFLDENGKFNYIINGADYDEATGDIVVSIRATGMIVRANLETSELKWIFADPKIVPKELKKYLLTPTDDTRYPYGQHNTEFMDNGRISYHNNDLDFLDRDLSLAAHMDRYSSSEIIVVDDEKKTVSTEWTYDDGKNIVSKMSGSLEFIEDGHKLVSYGSALDKRKFDKSEGVSITDFSKTVGLMEELDEKDNVIWQASFPSVIHKVYKSTFYDDAETTGKEVSNYSFEPFKYIDGQDDKKHIGEKVDTKDFKSDLNKAAKFEGSFFVKINRAMMDYEYKENDEIKLLFVNESGEGTLFNFKDAGKELPIVNSGTYGIRVNGLKGQQKAYVSINGTWYDTGKIYEFLE